VRLSTVAQTSSLLYRSASSLRRVENPSESGCSTLCRLEIGDTAGWETRATIEKDGAPFAVSAARAGLARRAFLWHILCMRRKAKREFSVVVERDEDGYYVASVPELPGCHTQARSLDKLIERIREAIELYLDVEHDVRTTTEFIGVQRITV
jgi:predicted RNase H-like HicB family nuclease